MTLYLWTLSSGTYWPQSRCSYLSDQLFNGNRGYLPCFQLCSLIALSFMFIYRACQLGQDSLLFESPVPSLTSPCVRMSVCMHEERPYEQVTGCRRRRAAGGRGCCLTSESLTCQAATHGSWTRKTMQSESQVENTADFPIFHWLIAQPNSRFVVWPRTKQD